MSINLKSCTRIGHDFPKKQLAKDVTNATIFDYSSYSKDVEVFLEELIGVEGQKPAHHIMPLHEMAYFIENSGEEAARLILRSIVSQSPK